LTTAKIVSSFIAPRITRTVAVTLALFGAMVPFIAAQEAVINTEAMLSLPDSPGAMLTSSSSRSSDDSTSAETSFDPSAKAPLPMALPRIKFIAAGQPAPPQRVRHKIEMGIRESITPFSMLGWVASSGYSHLLDNRPNYGTNSEAFAQRLGAAAALGSSKEIFSDAVMAPVFRQDMRYYQLGNSKSLFKRALYAATRPLIGRTDGGRTIPNYASLLGTAEAAALTQAYYPPPNQGASQVFQAFGTSVGGSAVGYLVSEFGGDIIQALHIRKHE